MKINVTGAATWSILLEKIIERIKPDVFAAQLAELMQRFVHVRTGFLRSTIYHYGDRAGASAAYAEYEANRGGEHDFATRAIDALDIDRTVTEALNGLY